jgi:hypothetical protein
MAGLTINAHTATGSKVFKDGVLVDHSRIPGLPWPDGTVVGAYPVAKVVKGERPGVAATASATVTAGALTFTGLGANEPYVLVAGVPVTGAQATDLLSAPGYRPVNGTPIVFDALTGGAGLSVNTVYYVRDAAADGTNFKVAATPGGAAINFTTDITAGVIRDLRYVQVQAEAT